MKSSNELKYTKLLSFFVSNHGYLSPNIASIDRTLYSFMLGKRSGFGYYKMELSILGIRHSLKVFEDIVSSGGKTLFIGGNNFLISSLLCLSFSQSAPVFVNVWDFSKIQKTRGIDLLFIHEVEIKSILEAQSKSAPLVGVHCSTLQGIDYPVHLTIETQALINWYLYAVLAGYRRGLYRRNSRVHEI